MNLSCQFHTLCILTGCSICLLSFRKHGFAKNMYVQTCDTLKVPLYKYSLGNTIKLNAYILNVLAHITYLIYSHIMDRIEFKWIDDYLYSSNRSH